MNNINKKNIKIQNNVAEKKMEEDKNSIILPTTYSTNLTQIFNNLEFINNEINRTTNILIPVMQMADRHARIIESVNIAYQSIHPIETFIKMTPPIDLIERITLTQRTLEQIHNSFNLINWNALNINLNTILQTISIMPFDFIITDKVIHAKALYEYVCEIDDEKISSVFTYEFIFKIINEDWWIIPRFDLEYYKKISKNMDNNINQNFLNEFYDNPNLIKDMVLNWNITSHMRRTIINQALFNYMEGNFEICVLTLVLQIEGIMKEKINYNKSTGNLRAALEQNLINKPNNNSWNYFLNKCNIGFIWNILNPIDDEIDFKEDMGAVNRNEIAHMGIVEADQLIAMRLFFIIDTLMYIFESI